MTVAIREGGGRGGEVGCEEDITNNWSRKSSRKEHMPERDKGKGD
jgi:hypothetical protein